MKLTEIGAIDANDPRVASARQFAHKHGLSQAAFSQMLSLYAESIISDVKAYNSAIEAEGKRLGPNASQRGQAVKSWLVEKLGPDRGNDLAARFTRASDVEAFEKLRGDTGASVLDRWYGPSR